MARDENSVPGWVPRVEVLEDKAMRTDKRLSLIEEDVDGLKLTRAAWRWVPGLLALIGAALGAAVVRAVVP